MNWINLFRSWPARPTNGRPCLVFVGAGAFADEHQSGVRDALAENNVLAPRGECATMTIPQVGANLFESLSTALRSRRFEKVECSGGVGGKRRRRCEDGRGTRRDSRRVLTGLGRAGGGCSRAEATRRVVPTPAIGATEPGARR
jgi:hypothetical protein